MTEPDNNTSTAPMGSRMPMPMNGSWIAKEGWPFLFIIVLVAGIASYFFGWWALPLWVLAFFVLQFFRDPPRHPPEGENIVLSPADGRIVALESTQDPWLNRPALKISVFMNVFNVHANRSPVSGQVKHTWYHPGKFVNAALDKASIENERAVVWLQTPTKQDVVSVQVAGLIARRILCYARQGDELQRAQRYGFIRFGSRVDVYVDPHTKPMVAPGDHVQAGVTILAVLPE